MKLNKLLYIALSSMALVGCVDLDTEPNSDTVTADQKSEVVEQDPDKVSASVSGITTMFSVYMNTSGNHNDFGYPSIMLFTDSRGIDLVGFDSGYNWFASGLDLLDRATTTYITDCIWSTIYNQIYATNQVVASIDPETDNSTLQFYLAQALAIRAFDYFTLAQLFQFTYEGNEDAPCVPLILNTNAEEAAANGIKRNTVGEVYDQIIDDLNNAVALLEASDFRRADKRYLSYDVALGLRARVELVMQDWAAAAADAEAAIKNSSANPISIAAASKPGFKAMTEPNWMWGIYIAETDRVVTSGIVNWPSHMGSLNYGYASVGAWRRINSTLYDQINPTDARKGWFLDGNATSANLTDEQQEYVDEMGIPAYTQVKFAPYGDELETATNANDIPLMRIEEMYLILAEAQAMGGNPSQGAATLQSFVQSYRDPAYTCTAGSAEAVQNAVWLQRRIELWGEGLSYYDLLRLRKGIDRASTAWKSMDKGVAAYNYQIFDTKEGERATINAILSGNGGATGEAINALIYQLPNAEIEGNPMLTSKDNNLGAPALEPVN
ncbi:MAG: RagB/SusD family nutrient uptake outer membrane protein [Prevotellaceae bacterium]|nr:RagB/SusD family nutrient uptake outer membrane protein [Prevotellaceae bacterium]